MAKDDNKPMHSTQPRRLAPLSPSRGEKEVPVPGSNLLSRPKPQLRSRGFLSHGGTPAAEGEVEKPKRSRGMLSHDAVNEGAPRELDPNKPTRPYRLEQK